MADESNTLWGYIIGGLGVIAVFFQWLLGGRKKEGSESNKNDAEARDVNLMSELRERDYFKKELQELRANNEDLKEKLRLQDILINDLQQKAIVRERRLTQLELLYNNTNKMK